MHIPTRIWAGTSFGIAAVLLALGGAFVVSAPPASADIISDGGALSLDAAPGVLSDDTMAPGDKIYWPISADLNATTEGTLTLQVTSSQPLATDPAGLELQLSSCPDPWTVSADPTVAPSCDGGPGTNIIPLTPFADIPTSKRWNLGTRAAVSDLPMMATLSLPLNVPASLQGETAKVNLGFTALGDTENANPSDPKKPPLATTGVDALGPLLLGIGLLLAGVTLGRLRVLAVRRSGEAAA
jgi:hypothetical protein